MLETPALYEQRIKVRQSSTQAGNLVRFRWHTGALPTPLQPDEVCPVLFRDIGFEAMLRFLNGDLTRLCGPVSPITYLRTGDYREPYIDFGRTGRLLLLRPLEIAPWHSGLPSIYIGPANALIDPDSMVFVPPDCVLSDVAARYADVRSAAEFSDAMGPSCQADAVADTRLRLTHLRQTHQAAELLAAPLRRAFQSMVQQEREQAYEQMQRVALTESDLCTAWHHMPDDRREFIAAALVELEASSC